MLAQDIGRAVEAARTRLGLSLGARCAMTFLLDTNVLLDFQNAELLPSLVHAAQTLDMAVAEKVFDEVTLPKANDYVISLYF